MLATLLTQAEADRRVKLSAYGFIKYLLDNLGYKVFWRNLGVNTDRVKAFAAADVLMRDDMPDMLVNASLYLKNVMARIYDREMAIEFLERMSFPYVLWLLYKGAGMEDMAKKYEDETYETLLCHPDCFSKLPESYQQYGKDLLCSRKH